MQTLTFKRGPAQKTQEPLRKTIRERPNTSRPVAEPATRNGTKDRLGGRVATMHETARLKARTPAQRLDPHLNVGKKDTTEM